MANQIRRSRRISLHSLTTNHTLRSLSPKARARLTNDEPGMLSASSSCSSFGNFGQLTSNAAEYQPYFTAMAPEEDRNFDARSEQSSRLTLPKSDAHSLSRRISGSGSKQKRPRSATMSMISHSSEEQMDLEDISGPTLGEFDALPHSKRRRNDCEYRD